MSMRDKTQTPGLWMIVGLGLERPEHADVA
jgi:hypothetical protein